jgi:LysR family transcriptional regulator, benzoate and cis,cis-muconate-responsive activator of ben and cat genes
VESRELRYFVAVAEELHFGKAAERLKIAQPPLSRAIAQLERQLGVTLLERTSRKVTLTEAGTELLAEGQAILTALTTAERRTRQAAAGQPGLVLAAKAGTSGELLTTLLDAYAAEPGAVPVGLLLCESQPQRTLPDGQADVALLHLPFDSTTGLDTETLHAEGQVAILPAAHPLAGRSHLRMSEVTALPELPMARWRCPDGTYPEGPGPEVGSLTQLFQLIALGRTTAVIPESASADLRHDLAAVPVLDAAAVTTVIAWPEHSRSRAVAGLVRAATRLHQAADPLSTSLPGQFTAHRRVRPRGGWPARSRASWSAYSAWGSPVSHVLVDAE